MDLDKTKVKKFFQFITERQMVWYRRYQQRRDPPWTKDKILNYWKFTNCYRMLDRGTLYLHNVLLPMIYEDDYAGEDRKLAEQLIFLNTVFYRVVNRIETIEHLKMPVVDIRDPQKEIERLRKTLYEYEQDGGVIFTNAHMVASLGSYKKPDGKKPWQKDRKYNRFLNGFEGTLENVDELLDSLRNADTGEDAFECMIGCAPQMGHFVTYEVWCDLIYTPILSRFHEDSFVNVGPGAWRGINALCKDESGVSKSEATDLLYWLREHQEEFLSKFPYFYFKRYRVEGLSLRSIEHSLCEYFKYHKALNDTGRPRNPYKVSEMDADTLQESTDSYRKLLASGITKGYWVEF